MSETYKKRLFIKIVTIFVFITISYIYISFTQTPSQYTAMINEASIILELAISNEEKKNGLSGRAYLKSGTGMLFVYKNPGIYHFWMKNINFPLDIIWLDRNKKIIHIERNLTPDTYPNTFTSEKKALYILETNTDELEKANIGDTFILNI